LEINTHTLSLSQNKTYKLHFKKREICRNLPRRYWVKKMTVGTPGDGGFWFREDEDPVLATESASAADIISTSCTTSSFELICLLMKSLMKSLEPCGPRNVGCKEFNSIITIRQITCFLYYIMTPFPLANWPFNLKLILQTIMDVQSISIKD